MDIERIKRLSDSKIKADDSVKKIRNTLKEYRLGRQDVQEDLSEVYKTNRESSRGCERND